MKIALKTIQVCILFILFSFILLLPVSSKTILAEKNVTFATFEYRPYSGNELPNNGYVNELISEVCKRIGYKVQIEFYPLARAKILAEEGSVDGLLPAFYDESLKEMFVFSDSFLGPSLGLLKRKSSKVIYSEDPGEDPVSAFKKLQNYSFGVVRGDHFPKWLFQIISKKIDYANGDLVNIDKLFWRRNDLIIVNRYTAADLIVKKRPHYIGKFEFLNFPMYRKPFHIAFSKKSEGYQQRQLDFNQGLKKLADDGTIERILNKHGLYYEKAAQKGKTILTIGTVNNQDMLVMRDLSKEFEKDNPGIHLNWRIMDENTLRLRLLSDLAIADGQFDIMTIGLYETPIWAKNKWITPLQSLPKKYDKEDIIQSIRDIMSYDGQLYALPFYAESSMTFYRTDLFKKAGCVMPSQPTYEDIRKFAAAIHDPENGVYGICLRGKPGWGENMGFLMTLVNSYGGYLFDDQWNPAINSPEWTDAISFYMELINKYGPPQPSANGYNENLELFSSGHCGQWIDATVSAGKLFDPKQSKVHNNFGFVNAPIALTPKGSHWLFSWALAIPESSMHKEAAQHFITWATSKDYIKLVAEKKGWGRVPPGTRKSTYANADYKAAVPFAKFVFDAIQTAQSDAISLMPNPDTNVMFVGTPAYTAILDYAGQEMGKVLDGKISLEEALRNSQEFASQQMRHSGYIK